MTEHAIYEILFWVRHEEKSSNLYCGAIQLHCDLSKGNGKISTTNTTVTFNGDWSNLDNELTTILSLKREPSIDPRSSKDAFSLTMALNGKASQSTGLQFICSPRKGASYYHHLRFPLWVAGKGPKPYEDSGNATAALTNILLGNDKEKILMTNVKKTSCHCDAFEGSKSEASFSVKYEIGNTLWANISQK